MTYRLLLDENVERVVARRLLDRGHDVEHVDRSADLRRGTPDDAIEQYARQTERVIVTDDDDFVSRRRRAPVLYVPDESLSAESVATIVTEIARNYPQREIDGVVYAGTNWL